MRLVANLYLRNRASGMWLAEPNYERVCGGSFHGIRNCRPLH